MAVCSRSIPIRHIHFISFLFLWRSGKVSEVSSDTASSSMHRWIVHEYFTASVRFTGLHSHWLHCHEKLNGSFKHWPAFLMNEAAVSAHLNPNENADFELILFPGLWRTLEDHRHVERHLRFSSWDYNDTSWILTSTVCLIYQLICLNELILRAVTLTLAHAGLQKHTHMLQHRPTTKSVFAPLVL